MAGQANIPVVSEQKIDTPGGTNGVLFIDSEDGNKLKVKISDGTILDAKVDGTSLIFEAK